MERPPGKEEEAQEEEVRTDKSESSAHAILSEEWICRIGPIEATLLG